MSVEVHDLEIDDVNREEMHVHGVSVRVAFEVVDGAPRVLVNRMKRGAPFLIVGPTSRGFVSLPIDPTNIPGLYRPRTGYPSKPSDIGRYERMGRKR